MTIAPPAPASRTNQYDDPQENYERYWDGRSYEHEAEVLALRNLLRGVTAGHAIDIGGGFGRLVPTLSQHADLVTLVDPSKKQLERSYQHLAGEGGILRHRGQADRLGLPDRSVDLACMVRVLHHLPDPTAAFAELSRVLRHGGLAVVESANLTHAANRLRYVARRERFPRTPVDIRSANNRERGSIPFVNHHPETVTRQLSLAGLEVERTLSVSNLRSTRLKGLLPPRALLDAERLLQSSLARLRFGPSLFFLLRRTDRA